MDPVEALALSHDVRLIAEWEMNGTTIAAAFGPGQTSQIITPDRDQIRLTYHANGQPTGVSWTQRIESNEVVIQQPWRDSGQCEVTLPDGTTGPVALAWQALGSRSEYVAELDAAIDHLTVVSPIWWYVREDGTLTNGADAAYVDAVHDRNVAVWPAVAGLDADANHLLLSDATNRSAAAQMISESARDSGADGVNVDIEGFRAEDAPGFLAFLQELQSLVHDWNGTISYDLIPRTDSWDVTPTELAYWSTAPPRRELSELVDCVILMAYDEHNRYRPAGPVASPPWVEASLTYLLRFADPSQIVLGVPFYGRIWDPEALDMPQAVPNGRLPSIPDDAVVFDAVFGIERATLPDGRFFWLETPELLASRMSLIGEYGLAGWAGWRMGLDSPELWDALDSS